MARRDGTLPSIVSVPSTPLLDAVRLLSFPRFAGTDGERRAADFVADRFAASGLTVRREPFRAGLRAIRIWRITLYGGAAALVAAASFAAPRAPSFAAFLSLVLLAALALGGRWSRAIEALFDVGPQIESQNVVGRRACGPLRSSAGGDGAFRLVVLAHIDSKSSSWPTFVPVAILLAAVAWSVALGAWCAIAAVGVSAAPAARVAAPIGLALAAALAALAFARAGNASPGAMDNASGVAVLLECARTLPEDSALAGLDLTFLATGAEEIGLAGAMRWMQSHAGECQRGRVLFLNLDSVGVGRGLLASSMNGSVRAPESRAPEGRAPGRRARARTVVGLINAAARAAGVSIRRLPFLVGAGVDTMPIAARGHATATILGQVLGAASRRMHTPRDTPEHLTEAALEDAARFVHAAACELAASLDST